MDIIQLKYIVELANELNFSKAAEKLFVTQSALSQQVHKIEEQIGFRIFIRSTRSVKITRNGEQVVAHARKVLKEYDELTEYLKLTSRGMTDSLRFATSPGSSSTGTKIMLRYHERNPQVHMTFSEYWDMQILDKIREDKIDLAFVLLPKSELANLKGIRFYPLYEDKICAMVDSQSPLDIITKDNIQGKTCIFAAMDSLIRRVILQKLDVNGTLAADSMIMSRWENRMPFIQNGAIGFGLHNKSKNRGTMFKRLDIDEDVDMTFCIAASDKIVMTAELRSFVEVAREVVNDNSPS